MPQKRILDGTTSDEGCELELSQEGDSYLIQIDGLNLMSSKAHHSEEEMAEMALASFARDATGTRWLVGGLGMGFTLRACLDVLDKASASGSGNGPGGASGNSVVVAETFDAVLEWNRGPLGHLADHPLDDPRVQAVIGDVFDQLQPRAQPFDIILLDVDNGPAAMTFRRNQRLYQERGLARIWACLSPGGVLAVWSAADDADFCARLAKVGFEVNVKDSPARRGDHTDEHVIFLAKRARTA